MLTENKFTRYLIYAFGEIILVVFGILIALSINNWNEQSKERKFERKMLSEIHLALENDIAYFENNVSRLASLDSAIDVMLGFIEEEAEFIDSMYNQDRGRSYYLATGIIYQYNPGPYEALKSTGVNKIRNDSLRKELITLYDFEYPRHQEFIEYYDQDYKTQIDRFFGMMDEPFIEYVNGKRMINKKFPPDLLKKPDFLNLLDEMRSRARLQLRSFNNFIPDLKRVESLLSEELKN
ncbi:hypothetical protein SAMN05444394_0116 [Algoriphagus halophilus]|uniref:Uncharacterized protein n=2 Tax=Algoriphagus halophilus TaxID=226505 RepID=A0A1N6D3E8_9BACT|nr:hypothetical protein SAMN05444394_0116 [Algoriphagus halophilus]